MSKETNTLLLHQEPNYEKKEHLPSSRTSLSARDKSDPKWFIENYKDDIYRLMPDEISTRKTLLMLADALGRRMLPSAQRDCKYQNMTYQLDFEKLASFDNTGDRVVLEAEIRYSDVSVRIDAHIDTGAAYSIFERHFGEDLGLESGMRQ
jgi:hypothetical protein